MDKPACGTSACAAWLAPVRQPPLDAGPGINLWPLLFCEAGTIFLDREQRGLSNVGENRSKMPVSTESYVISSSYSGRERRLGERRNTDDRRGETRLEGKLPRRSGKGRRKGERLGLFLRDLADH